MSILYTEGFERMTNNESVVQPGWFDAGSGFTIVSTSNYRTGTRSLRVYATSSQGYAQKNLPSTYQALYIGFNCYGSSLASNADYKLVSVVDGTTEQLYFRNERISGTIPSCAITAYRGDGTLLGTSTALWQPGYHTYFEFKFVIDNTVGAYECKMNGVSILSGSGVDTQVSANAYADRFRLCGGANEGKYFDDVYVADDGYKGVIRVEPLFPNGNGNYSQWTGSDGNSTDNYLLVDESTTPNGDTDYVASSTPDQLDSYVMANLANNGVTVKSVKAIIQARKDDTNVRQLALLCRSGSTDSVGTTRTMTTTYTFYEQVWETDPATAAAWAGSAIDAAEFGVKLVA